MKYAIFLLMLVLLACAGCAHKRVMKNCEPLYVRGVLISGFWECEKGE